MWLVHDRERAEDVALKRLNAVSAGRLAALKREFRGLADLTHPYLVRVYELGDDDDGAYFTMEAVNGVDLETWRAQHDSISEIKRLVLLLCDALAFLHDHGIVHGDLKPSNVMVRSDGSPVLLDFGALTRLGDADPGSRVGTLGYVAPEVIEGATPSPASDRYGLGALLFTLLAGEPPFAGAVSAVLRHQLDEAPPRLRERRASIDPVLDALCADLMARSPAERPGLPTLRAQLGASSEDRGPRFPNRGALVGRGALLDDLWARCTAAREGAELIVLRGPSGVGKTALLDALEPRLLAAGSRVLRGRARLEERIPYNLFDGAVDELALALRRHPPKGPFEQAARRATDAFPALARATGQSLDRGSVRRRVAAGLFGTRPPPRLVAFEGLASLLTASPTALLLDDLQWADGDAIALLDHLMNATRHPLLLLGSARDETSTPALDWLATCPEVAVLDVPGLDERAMRELLRRHATKLGVGVDDAVLDAVATTCDGRPFLAEVAVRAMARGDGASLADLVEGLGPPEDVVFATLVAAGGRMTRSKLASLTGVAKANVLRSLDAMAREGLVRLSTTEAVDLYHDGVREAALRVLPPAAIIRAHGRLADDLVDLAHELPRRVDHLLRAGRRGEAVAEAPAAAERAMLTRAYGLAAELYALAIEDPESDRRTLCKKQILALERCGRFEQAAELIATLLHEAPEEEHEELMSSYAQALLASNQVSRGAAVLDRALHLSGKARIGHISVRDLVAAGRFLVGPLRAPRLEEHVPVDEASARDVRLGTIVSFFNPLAGVRYLLKGRDVFDRSGMQLGAARCELILAHYAQFGRPGPGLIPLSRRYRRHAEQRIETFDLDDPVLRATLDFIDGFDAMRLTQWDASMTCYERAGDRFDEAGLVGTFEHLLLRSYACFTPFYAQRPALMTSFVRRFRAAAAACGDTALRTHLALVEMGAHLLFGRIERARAAIDTSMKALPADRHTIQRDVATRLSLWVAVHDGEPETMLRQSRAVAREAWRYGLDVSAQASMYAGILAMVEAVALRAGVPGASRRRLRKHARIARAGPPLLPGLASRALAYGASASHRPDEALALLEQAEHEASALGQRIDVAIAQHQRGLRLGGDEGASLRAGAREAVSNLGVDLRVLDEDVGFR